MKTRKILSILLVTIMVTSVVSCEHKQATGAYLDTYSTSTIPRDVDDTLLTSKESDDTKLKSSDPIVGEWYSLNSIYPCFTLYNDGTCKVGQEYGLGSWNYSSNILSISNYYGHTDHYEVLEVDNNILRIDSSYRSESFYHEKKTSTVITSIQDFGKPIKVDVTIYGGLVLFDSGIVAVYGFDYTDQMTMGKPTGDYCLNNVMDKGIDIALGQNVAFVIDEDHNLWAWGCEETVCSIYGIDSTPRIILEDVKSVNVSKEDYYTELIAIIKNDNSLWLWGNPGKYLMDVPCYEEPVKIFDDVQQVVVENDSGTFLTSNGDMYMWGFMNYHAKTPEKYKENVQFVATDGVNLSYVSEGCLFVYDFYSKKSYSVQNGIDSVCISGSEAIYLTKDKQLYSWCNNESAFQNEGLYVSCDPMYPTFVMDKVIDYSISGWSGAAIIESGEIYVWGGERPSLIGLGIKFVEQELNYDHTYGNHTYGNVVYPTLLSSIKY